MSNVADKVERKAASVVIDKVVKGMKKDRDKEIAKIVDYAEKFLGDSYPKEVYDSFRVKMSDPNYKWVKFIDKFLDETDPHVAKTILLNMVYQAMFKGTNKVRKSREKYNCNVPWLILFDPTSACNMHCKGCWAGEYGNKYNLSFDDMDKIVSEGKELGIYFYMLTGGEPLVRKADILKIANKHNDCMFAIFTNSTLIDQKFCDEVKKVGNITFQLSIEGTEETNDARRGEGHYKAVMKAMDLLKKNGLLFGTSICYTRQNIDAITSDEFLKMLVDKGARYAMYFHYMPVGNNAVKELLPTPEQREYMIKRLRYIRSDECDLPLFPIDFQNDGEFVGGCIAGGRNYFHINSAGDAEPCVFIHYSDANIHDKSILEILQSPLFEAYHDGQPFNRNHLRPCPMLENPEKLRKIVKETGAKSTDLESPETAEHLCAKCDDYAENWKEVADKLWDSKKDDYVKNHNYQNYKKENVYKN